MQTLTNNSKPGLYLIHILFKCSKSRPRLFSSQSHKITLYPNCKKGVTEVDHETEGKITVLFFKNLPSSNDCAINKLADDPELTNTENFDPKKFENFFSNFLVTSD